MRTLYLVRHAPPVVTLGKPAAGWPLVAEAAGLIDGLMTCIVAARLRRIVSSPERKAVETADRLASHMGLTVEVHKGLEEHHRGLNDQTVDTESFHGNMATFFKRPNDIVFGTESAAMARRRIDDTVARIINQTHDDELVVSHGTVIALFAARGNTAEAWSTWLVLRQPDCLCFSWPDLIRRDP